MGEVDFGGKTSKHLGNQMKEGRTGNLDLFFFQPEKLLQRCLASHGLLNGKTEVDSQELPPFFFVVKAVKSPFELHLVIKL